MRPTYSNPDHGRWRNSPPTRGGHQRSYSSNDRNFNQNRDDVSTQVFWDFWEGNPLLVALKCSMPLFRGVFRTVSKMELFTKISNGFQPLTIFAKSLILDIWQGSEYASAAGNKTCKVCKKTLDLCMKI